MPDRRSIKRGLLSRMVSILELPDRMLPDAPQLTLSGRERMVVEGVGGVLLCEPEQVAVNTSAFVVRVTGRRLELRYLNGDTAYITGHIELIEFV